MAGKRGRVVTKTKVDRMVSTLREEIRTGIRKDGDYLPPELDLCDIYGISKNTVRKGLELLVQEGWIEKVPRIGAKVIGPKQTAAVVLKLGMYSSLIQEASLLKLIGLFERKYPNISVQPVPIQVSRDREYMKSRFMAEQMDVVTLNVFDFDSMAATGGDDDCFLTPLHVQSDTYAFLTKLFGRNGALYAQPFSFTPVVLCYNRNHFREAHVSEPDSSWTWDELRNAGRRLSKTGERYGFYFHIPYENRWPLFLLQHGVDIQRGADGAYSLQDVKLDESLELMMELIGDRELFPAFMSENDRDVQSLFMHGRVSMIITTYDSLNAFREAPFEYDIAPVPYSRQAKTLLNCTALGVPRTSRQQAAARLFVEFLASYEAQLALRQQTLSIPALKEAAEWKGDAPDEAAALNRPSRFALFREIIPTFHTYRALGLSYGQLMMMRDELKMYWSGFDPLDVVLGRIEQKLL